MRCTSCDGTGLWVSINQPDGLCRECNGSRRLSNDLLIEKVSAATAKIGMVYFIRDDVNNRIKIGTSINPIGRLRNLQTGSSVRLRLMAMAAGGRKSEAINHEIFAQYRLAGEWFDDSNRQITRILLASLSKDGSFWPDSEEP